MSGIAGVYFLDSRPVDPGLLERMTDCITHRGPDGQGHWVDGSVGLGHRMLHATPESLNEKLPMSSDRGNLVITADARIDNRDELISLLEIAGRPKDLITDAELILRAYEKWDEACPYRLLGDFAFAIWNREKQRLFCACDPMGIKPLYYYFDGQKFLLASEIKQILEDRTVPVEPNLALIGLYLLEYGFEREATLYQGIQRLLPAHSLTLNGGGVKQRQYWDIDPENEIRYRTDREYADHFLALFVEAVRCCLRSHASVGAFLSGGLDSSSIACVAQKLYSERSIPSRGFETYSILFDTMPCDERKYIEEVIRKWNVKANYVTFEKAEAAIDIEQARRYGDLFYDPMNFTYFDLLSDAQRKGTRVCLWGVGGDELMAASFYHLTDLLYQGRIRVLIEQLQYDAVQYRISPLKLAWNFCVKPLVPAPLKAVLRPLVRRFRRNQVPPWIQPEFIERTGLNARLKQGESVKKFPTRSQQELYNLLLFSWNATVGLTQADLMASACSMEFRYPFFDRRLIEFLLGIPEEQRWWMERPKAILRRALDGILPEAIRGRRGKAEFSPPLDREYRDRQREKIASILRHSALERMGIIDGQRLRELFEAYRRGSSQYLTVTVATVVSLELWLRHFMDVKAKRR